MPRVSDRKAALTPCYKQGEARTGTLSSGGGSLQGPDLQDARLQSATANRVSGALGRLGPVKCQCHQDCHPDFRSADGTSDSSE